MFKILIHVLCSLGLSECLKFITPNNVDQSLVVPTASGYVQGIKKKTYTGTTYWAYQGIPFAKPPLGALRFRPPEKPLPWKGVLDGTEEANCCVETSTTLQTEIVTFGDEDCLYINVYTPTHPLKQKGYLPVLAWIYGGAFMFGNSSSSFYGSDNFLDQNIITVTFNYRIGPFGFLSTSDLESPGNYGLKDQNFALKWIQNNIENFGGDKNRVTLAGQSAGAASVLYQLASPKSNGLFSSAIAISGSPLCQWAFNNNAAKVAFEYGLAMGIKTTNSEELMEKLRKADIEDLKRASRKLLTLFIPLTIRDGFPFAPTLEPNHNGAFITKSIYSVFDKGEFNKVPIMMGMNSLETLFFSRPLQLLKPISIIFDVSPSSLPSERMNIRTQPEKRQAGLEIIKQYFKGGSYIGSTDNEYFQFTSDDRFTRPMHKTAQLISRHSPLIYLSLFSYVSDFGDVLVQRLAVKKPLRGVGHAEDLFYVWKRKGIPLPVGHDKIIATRMIKIWSNFIKTGNPTPIKEEILDNIIWPAVTSQKNITYFEIGNNVSVQYNYRQKQMTFWKNLYRKYGHPPYVTY